jgi:OOP family OmpA-OmpF porin
LNIRPWIQTALIAICIATFAGAPSSAVTPLRYMVFFDFGKTDVGSQGEVTVNAIVEIFGRQKQGQAVVVVEGHSDSAEASFALSSARAEVIKRRLVELGIPSDQIRVESRGDTSPVAWSGVGAREPQNRRVELTFQ